MAESGEHKLLRKPDQPQLPTFLELFFDLVFIFALTRASDRLVRDLTDAERIALTEVGQSLVLLLAMLMVWFVTAWVTDLYDPKRPEIQLLVVAAMFGVMLMAITLPAAFGNMALIFAGVYVAIHLSRGLYLVSALRGHITCYRAFRVLLWFSTSGVAWIAGALVAAGIWRGVLWTVAVAIEYTGALLLWPPLFRRETPESQWPVMAEYLAERYRLFFIVALGEQVLASGTTFADTGFAVNRTAALVVSFATTVLLWRIYIYRAGDLLDDAIASARDPARLIRLTLLAHLLMATGIVLIAATDKLVIANPSGRLDPTWLGAFFGGPALFLIGRAIFEYAVFARVSRNRLIGLLLLAVLAPAMPNTPPLATDAVAMLILAAIAITDTMRARTRPPEPPSPPH